VHRFLVLVMSSNIVEFSNMRESSRFAVVLPKERMSFSILRIITLENVELSLLSIRKYKYYSITRKLSMYFKCLEIE
jgi:hypothetical protein